MAAGQGVSQIRCDRAARIPDLRGRGLRWRARFGLSCEQRPDQTHRGDVSGRGCLVCLSLLRGARDAQFGDRTGGLPCGHPHSGSRGSIRPGSAHETNANRAKVKWIESGSSLRSAFGGSRHQGAAKVDSRELKSGRTLRRTSLGRQAVAIHNRSGEIEKVICAVVFG